MENDFVIPSKPIFYHRSVHDIYSIAELEDNVFHDQLNNYHPNIKLTTEVNSTKFLETKLTNTNSAYKFDVYQNNTKLPSPWTSKTPKRYQQNTINGDLHRLKRISYPSDKRSVINEFQKGKECGD